MFNAASEKTDTIQIIKSRICEAEHNLIQFEDFVHQLKLQLSSLEKRKKLALKNSEFDTAATLAAEIKETKITLNNSLKTEQDSSTSDQDRAMLIKEADAFVDLIRQQGLLKKASSKVHFAFRRFLLYQLISLIYTFLNRKRSRNKVSRCQIDIS